MSRTRRQSRSPGDLLGFGRDVDVAVAAARRAFALVAEQSRRAAGPVAGHPGRNTRSGRVDLADAVTEEIGAPPSLAAGPQVFLGSVT